MDDPLASTPQKVDDSIEIGVVIGLVFIGILLCAVVVGLWFYLKSHPIPIFSEAAPGAYVTLGEPGDSAVYGLNITQASSTPSLFKPTLAGGRTVVGYASDATTTYYLLQSATSTALVSASTKNQKMLSTITDSSGAKSELTYNSAAHLLSYVLMDPEENQDVETFDTSSGARQMIATGTDPVILPGGIMILLREGRSLVVVNRVSSIESTLLSIIPGAPYAVSPDGQTLAIYNPPTKNIDYYDLSNVTSASYQKSTPVSIIPTTMAYKGSQLDVVGPIAADSSEYELQTVGGSVVTKFALPSSALVPVSITFP
jgi:hypothetical protein